jgi:DNA polymerase
MRVAHLDFETRSTVNLKKQGTDIYAKHPTTDVWCMSYAFDDNEPEVLKGGLLPKSLRDHVGAGGLVYAHNAAFELDIWNKLCVPRYGFPRLDPKQVRCTMAMAYAMALPGSLQNAAAAVGLEEAKNMDGHRLMMQMAKPRRIEEDGTIVWWDDEDRKTRLFEYCKQDVRTERALHKRLRELSPAEQALWVLDYEINERGVPVDLESINKAIATVEREKKRLDLAMNELTGGAVAACSQVMKLQDWVNERIDRPTKSLAKADVNLLLGTDLPDEVRRALLLRQEAAKTSTAKLDAMKNTASEDGRVRMTMQYHAASTGRWGGRKMQPHNFKRPDFKQGEIEDAISRIDDTDYLDIMYGNPLDVISSCLRGMICAEDKNEFVTVDFANIEGRVLAWLAGEEWKIEAFEAFDNGTGPDIYKLGYSKSFGVRVDDITSEQRQVGKVQELALGYQGGVGAFQQMARGYGVEVSDERAESIKTAWRKAHSKIVQFWYDIERASVKALLSGGNITCGPVTYRKNGSFLWCKLPSGRVLCYPYPQIQTVKTPWGADKDALTYKTVDSLTKKWVRIPSYGGLLVENITQAVARDILAESIWKLDKAGMNPIFHVHDEVVCDLPAGNKHLDRMEKIMSEVPKWAEGLPIAVEGWQGRRYRK